MEAITGRQMRRIGVSALFCTAALTTGCSSVPQRWYLNGKSNEQFQGDYASCQQQAQLLMDAGSQSAMGISQQSNPANYKAAGTAGLMALALSLDISQAELLSCLKKLGYTPAS
jgi:hypothetical protein